MEKGGSLFVLRGACRLAHLRMKKVVCRDFIYPFKGVCICASARKGIYFIIGNDFFR
jgi:hypothetical protein